MAEKYDFSGWATANDYKCADGRTIRRGAFSDCDGMTVPLVWGHDHSTPSTVLGHGVLEEKDEGMYFWGSFNNSQKGQEAKEAVAHGDIKYLSIYANHLKQTPEKDVLHGMIREVSLVYASANPGAYIDNAVLAHSDGTYEELDDEAIICFFKDIELSHSDEKGEETVADENKDTQEEKKTNAEDIWNSMNDDQQELCRYLADTAVDQALKERDEKGEEKDDEVEHSDEEGEEFMKHNVFDGNDMQQTDVLSHDEMQTIIADAKRYGSMRDSFLAHAEDYGIEQIDWLFPEAREQNTPPEYIKRQDNWVSVVMSGVHHTPFSRLKSTYADITEDEARARGYLKGRLKKEEVFSLLKRTTQPTTVYKKQKLDRDDTIDITDFDVISWLKSEMRVMLDEELAGAYLVGDGRLASDDDKIDPNCIRPIVNEADLFNIKYSVAPSQSVSAGTSIEDSAQYYAENFIKAAIRARKGYKGSGSPIMFTTESMLCEMLLLEDTQKHPLYKTEAELATKMRVSRIVTIPDEVMARGTYNGKPVLAIIVNLDDYRVGADNGGSINMFDDFDIDYNQMKYLIETRCSGSLMKPFSAITLYADSTTARTSKIVGDEDFDSKSAIGS